MSNKNILFLYSELAGYTLACLRSLRAKTSGRIGVIHWPVNSEAPFDLVELEGVDFYSKKNAQWREFALSLQWDTIFVSGWIDQDYIKLLPQLSAYKVVGIDTPWRGNSQQRLKSFLARFFLASRFDAAWVAGSSQKELALAMGIKKVCTGVYAADTELFSSFFDSAAQAKEGFLYVGRYSEEKGINDLWEAYRQYRSEGGSWSLTCAGTGPLYASRPRNVEGLNHLGFLQPTQLSKALKTSACFVLPSRSEPWGVVIHEMALAGQLLLSTREVHSTEQFLKDQENGLLVDANQVSQLTRAMHLIANWSESKVLLGRQLSHQLGSSYSTGDWADKLLTIESCAE